MFGNDLFVVPLMLAASFVQQPPATPQPPAPGASRITHVVVYPEHAEVTREISVEAVPGLNAVRFLNLIPLLNPNTLRASVSAGARIAGTEIQKVFLNESVSEEINVLDARIQELTDELSAESDGKARLAEQAAFYASVKGRLGGDMTRELTDSRPTVAEWENVLAFVDAGLQRCDDQRRAIEAHERSLGKELSARSDERKEFAGRQPLEVKEALVSFHSETGGPTRVEIHYMVEGAVWKPSYDVHLDRATEQIEITGYGQVMQWTGEAWDDVELSLAMTRPDLELALPELTPMQASLDATQMIKIAQEVGVLNAVAQGSLQKWMTGRFQRRQDRETFRRNLELLSRYSEQALVQYGLNADVIRNAMSRLVDRFAAVRYEVAQRESIPFNSAPHKVVAFSATVPAKLKYVATPALGNSVLLQGEIVNTTGHPILEGSVAIFGDESYIGTSQQSGAAQNEGLAFGFGPDDGLIVDRHLVSRTVKGPEAFRLSQVITYRYEIVVESFNQRAVEVEVTDQIPVSTTAEIQVTFLESSRPHTLDPKSGMLRWTLDAAAGSPTTIAYVFQVECPVGQDVHWQ